MNVFDQPGRLPLGDQIEIPGWRRRVLSGRHHVDRLLFGGIDFLRIGLTVTIYIKRYGTDAGDELSGFHIKNVVQVVETNAQRIFDDCVQ